LAGRLPHEYSSLTELALKQQEETVEPLTVHRPDVPPELDRAIRVCLAREPYARYASTLEMAQALDAGLHGEVTDSTRMLAATAVPLDGTGATRALGQTEATRAMRRGQTGAMPAPAPVGHRDPTGAYPPAAAPEPSKAEKRARRNRRLGGILALLAVLVAVAAVAVVLTSTKGPTGPKPVDRGAVPQQIDGLKQFLRENSR
ncbi:MAG: hypothetical protein ACR2J6_07285, partial [Thermoleophilaceae bacterium]